MYKNKKTNIFYLRALYMCITILPKIEDSDTLGNPIEIKKKQINFYASTWDRKNWLDCCLWVKKKRIYILTLVNILIVSCDLGP